LLFQGARLTGDNNMTGSEHLMTTYAPMQVCFEQGEGAVLRDDQGNEYLDALAGIAAAAWAMPIRR